MKVEKVCLQNVKSYGDGLTEISLGGGVNAILGENGAGKSTVLEAVGYALFDFLNHYQQKGKLESELTPESEKVLREELPEGVEGQHISKYEIRFSSIQELSAAVAELFSVYGREYKSVSFSVSVKIMGTEVDLFDEGDLKGLMEEMEPEEEMKRCPECGHVSFDRSSRCPGCGHQF
ncbi:hypothetical protein AKJ41_00730 [candidate division MSBL1 archaeon SCGC-AAA259O05]|uniref:Rad50/SbcC-type AAA domain-containing protein n=1 Tax=candidate division MSBL1 archaeon SCGC-AAA259O05 TaxID=1698271 RepID=A0A133V5E0_9EURY|nr:hypothetical protein AKJ41_00730 [candidate division MSBL1 archaeon SCGC-AAA259O05]